MITISCYQNMVSHNHPHRVDRQKVHCLCGNGVCALRCVTTFVCALRCGQPASERQPRTLAREGDGVRKGSRAARRADGPPPLCQTRIHGSRLTAPGARALCLQNTNRINQHTLVNLQPPTPHSPAESRSIQRGTVHHPPKTLDGSEEHARLTLRSEPSSPGKA